MFGETKQNKFQSGSLVSKRITLQLDQSVKFKLAVHSKSSGPDGGSVRYNSITSGGNDT